MTVVDDVLGLPYVPPMLATAGSMPPVADQHKWSYEMKWDGVRAVAYVNSGELALFGRSGRDFTTIYPEVSGLATAFAGRTAVLDGEVVAFDELGRPSFETLQQRMHGLTTGARSRRRGTPGALPPVSYLVFDLLYVDGRSLLPRPYTDRRSALDALELAGPNWQVPPVFDGMGQAALDTSVHQHLEGVVAKRHDSRYEPGRRSQAWVKIKNFRTQEVVIGGWRVGEGSRSGTFGSLLCGVYEGGRLRYAGRVGSGFTQEKLAALTEQLAPLARSTPPFDEQVPALDARNAHWVEPVLVGEVAFTQWTRDGRLRNPSWRGLRPDKDPLDVVREP
jgi:bifunctional non-homologous end joining protein LigD